MAYAERTDVPVSRSKAEIEGLVERYGGDRYQSGWDADRALVAFECEGRRVRFVLPLPAREDYGSQRAFEQEQRRRWRALALVVKAKLESWQSGIESFSEAFMPQLVLPDNTTVAERVMPLVNEAYTQRSMQPFLPLPLVLALPARAGE